MILQLLLLLSLFLSTYSIGPISPNFESFLNKHNYGRFDFARRDLDSHGSFGGRTLEAPTVQQEPVIFIHGNSDSALQSNDFSTGFSNTTQYFLSHGYTMADLYATSWGDTNTSLAIIRYHDCKTMVRMRAFLEAVLKYTEAPTVSIIAHSMGVTIARKIIRGGVLSDKEGACDLGESLSSRIGVLVGMSGANFGLCYCGKSDAAPTCDATSGLFSGLCGDANDSSTCGHELQPQTCDTSKLTYSRFLMEMNDSKEHEARKIFSVWSSADELIGNKDVVWGRHTSYIPNSDGQLIYEGLSHMATKEATAADQFHMISTGNLPSY